MKRFTVPCSFGDQKSPFHIYIGEADAEMHPIRYQAAWLQRERGGTVPEEVMESFGRLRDIALENKVSFEDLCVYALGAAENEEKE